MDYRFVVAAEDLAATGREVFDAFKDHAMHRRGIALQAHGVTARRGVGRFERHRAGSLRRDAVKVVRVWSENGRSRSAPARRVRCGFGGLLLAALSSTFAQTSALPAPSRTVFKCVVAGKTVYSDEPCPAAVRIEVQPTRGLGKSAGTDVKNERTRESVASALKPLNGMTHQKFKVRRRRGIPERRSRIGVRGARRRSPASRSPRAPAFARK